MSQKTLHSMRAYEYVFYSTVIGETVSGGLDTRLEKVCFHTSLLSCPNLYLFVRSEKECLLLRIRPNQIKYDERFKFQQRMCACVCVVCVCVCAFVCVCVCL